MRPPASEFENRTNGAKKIGPSQHSDFFNRIDPKRSNSNGVPRGYRGVLDRTSLELQASVLGWSTQFICR